MTGISILLVMILMGLYMILNNQKAFGQSSPTVAIGTGDGSVLYNYVVPAALQANGDNDE